VFFVDSFYRTNQEFARCCRARLLVGREIR